MALSGLEVYKLLPKTNCRECGFPTCLAFAMKLAAKQAELAACPHVSEEAKKALEAASAPPIRLITFGKDDHKVEVGNETVIFRHEKTFYHPPALLVRVTDATPPDELEATVAAVDAYEVERVGLRFGYNGIAVQSTKGDASAFAACVARVRAKTKLPLLLMAKDPAVLAAGLEKEGGLGPMLYAATPDNWKEMAKLAAAKGVPLVAKADADLSALAELCENLKGAGIQDLVVDPGKRDPAGSLVQTTALRRLALKQNFRPLGYPIITFPGEGAESLEMEAVLAGQHIAKYGGFIVLDHHDPAMAYILLTLRLNIYTDPQKPIQVSPGIYEFTEPAPESPLMVTTNFSLTYFSVAGEVEGAGKPAWLLVCDSEGMSVLTAWAAGKFDAELIAKMVKQFGVESKINHRKIIIPGFVAAISGELEDELPGWEIMVGPREAVDIPAYLKQVWSS
ncbi:MAG: acetyl-CoA decarbonylase/synthase complex subunit gamma [Anaerolineae bacterium]